MWILHVLSPMSICVGQSDLLAAAASEGASGLRQVMYVVVGIAVIIGVIAMIARSRRGLGHDEGDHRGPRPGDGAVVHHSSGEIDFDGSAGNALSQRKDPERDLPYPSERSAD
jgi:uncharacterized membrane protein YuzA (DUF378 family)